MKEKTYRFTFYFVSKRYLTVDYNEQKFNEQLKVLQDWSNVVSIGPKWGINFSLVTHYTVEEI